MSGTSDCGLNIVPFVEWRVIHHDDCIWRKFGKQILHNPLIKDIRVNVDVK